MRFSQLSGILNGEIHITKDQEINHFSTDSRSLLGKSDEVFLAIVSNRDGHNFIQDAVACGVENFIVQKPSPALDGKNFFLVEDSIRSFQKIAVYHREKFKLPVIGITGSNGKTTVKEWLATLLSERYFVAKNPKSYNSQIGVPLSVLGLGANHDVGLFEAGISKENEMDSLQKIIKPSIGLFTTLGQAHNEGFDSMQQKLHEKLKLFTAISEVIYRSDAPYSQEVQSFISPSKLVWSLDGSGSIPVKWSSGEIQVHQFRFNTCFFDPTDLENATHAIVASLVLGLTQKEIQAGLNRLTRIPMRLEFKKGINGCYLLDDTYNNDLAGLKVALDHLVARKENEKKTLILSDILQTGLSKHALYKKVNQLLIERKVERLIGVGVNISSVGSLFKMETAFFNSTETLIRNLPEFEEEMILLKGARDFQLERVSKLLEAQIHGTVLEVNFDALYHNLTQYRSLLKPETKMMVMVKANAYGAGILEIANFLQHQRIDQLGVAYTEEAIQLRKNGITLPIMIMNPFIESFSQFEKYSLQAEIFSLTHLQRLLNDTRGELAIQIKIETGMNRLGFKEKELEDLLEVLSKIPRITVVGIFTHFSSSDDPTQDSFTNSQAKIFNRAYEKLSNGLGYRPTKHASNSPAMVRWPQYHYDMVRLGIGLHGYDPTQQLNLRPASRLKTLISQIQYIQKDETVGYSRKGRLKRESKIAILPIGYEDGFNRVFGNRNATVKVGGTLCPIIGNVCMDMTMIDISDTDAKEGDEVIIFGDQPTIQDLAKWAHTIPYEILTNVSSRVKRIFIWE